MDLVYRNPVVIVIRPFGRPRALDTELLRFSDARVSAEGVFEGCQHVPAGNVWSGTTAKRGEKVFKNGAVGWCDFRGSRSYLVNNDALAVKYSFVQSGVNGDGGA